MSRNFLSPTPSYYIVKVAGDYGSKDKSYFVATNRNYPSRSEAERIAKELSLKTPGNRYYVVQQVSGFLTHEPATDVKVYR